VEQYAADDSDIGSALVPGVEAPVAVAAEDVHVTAEVGAPVMRRTPTVSVLAREPPGMLLCMEFFVSAVCVVNSARLVVCFHVFSIAGSFRSVKLIGAVQASETHTKKVYFRLCSDRIRASVCVCVFTPSLFRFFFVDTLQSVGDFSSRIAMRCRDFPAVTAAALTTKATPKAAAAAPSADTLALVYLEFATPAACQAAVSAWHKSKFLDDRMVVAISCSAAEVEAAVAQTRGLE
jgi:hypothetical protein